MKQLYMKTVTAQLNTKLTVDNFSELIKYRKTTDCLSKEKLADLLENYTEYQQNNTLDKARIVHMSKSELLAIN